MKTNIPLPDNENGSVMFLVVIMLAVVTIIGIFSINTSTTELNIARNDKLFNMAFYAAEAARGYVPPHTELYSGDNVTVGATPLTFSSGGTGNFSLSANDSQFDGGVAYVGSSESPRGSGYEASKFKAHRYEMTCRGRDETGNSEITVESGFYRIGF